MNSLDLHREPGMRHMPQHGERRGLQASRRSDRARATHAPRLVADARCAAYAHNAAVRHFYHDLSNQSTRLSLSHGHMQLLR